jgi:hypothetical protein
MPGLVSCFFRIVWGAYFINMFLLNQELGNQLELPLFAYLILDIKIGSILSENWTFWRLSRHSKTPLMQSFCPARCIVVIFGL